MMSTSKNEVVLHADDQPNDLLELLFGDIRSLLSTGGLTELNKQEKAKMNRNAKYFMMWNGELFRRVNEDFRAIPEITEYAQII